MCKETQQPEHYAKELSWAEVVGQVEANKPVAFSWEWAGGGGHMLVLYGYHTDADGVGWVSVHDPLPVNQGLTEDMTYDTYVAKPGEYQHWKDFYDIGKAGVGWRLETPIWIDGQRDRTIAPLAALAVLAYAPRGAALSDDRAPSEQPVRDPVPAAPLLQPASAPDQVAQLARAAVLAAQPAAPSGVRSLKVEARRRFAELGFNSIEEARAAILGDGLAVLRIRLDDLKAFQPVQSVFDLLRTAPDQVIWSVTSSFRVCSSVTTDLRDGKWTATRYGAANRIAGIAGARAVLRQHNAGAPPAAEYIISVPALNVMLVAHQDAGGSVVVAPTADHPSLALDSKKAEPVVDVLTRLVAGANNVNATCPG